MAHPPRQKINVSIDFGTTYSAVARLDTTKVSTPYNYAGTKFIPFKFNSIEGNQPIVTDLIYYSNAKDKVFMNFHMYEARTSFGLEPHLYPRDKMKVHATISAHFDLKAARRHSFKLFRKKGDCDAIPYQLVAKYFPTHYLMVFSDTKDQVFMNFYIYEAKTSLGLEPHFYPRDKMKVHAHISARFNLKPARRFSFRSFRKKGACYAIPACGNVFSYLL